MRHFDIQEVCSGKCPNPLNPGEYFKAPTQDSFEAAYRDAEKIINSSAFRRMQGKTQVYPFPDTDAVRNRLTHSIEVSHIGQAIAARVMQKTSYDQEYQQAFQQIVSNGCLLHDIGNPPFGHSGEESIREYFNDNLEKSIIQDAFKKSEYRNDFQNFDGNAQGFRIITVLNGRKYKGGLRLGAASASAMVKYPYGSDDPNGKKGKFGFMASEQEYFHRIFSTCGLMGSDGKIYRNPASIVVEAADDIAYLTADLQDALVYKDLKENYVFKELARLADSSYDADDINSITDENDKIAAIRSAAVSRMIQVASDNIFSVVFKNKTPIDRYAPLKVWDAGAGSHIADSEDRIRENSNLKIYRGRKKMALQVAGGRIIKFILQMQISALDELYRYLISLPANISELDTRILEQIEGAVSEFRIAKYIVDTIEKKISREASQVLLRMPNETHDEIKRIIEMFLNGSISREAGSSTELAYRLLQLSVDFVSGTTDRYISGYSRDWGGPYVV